jgi:hypothetical protein
MKKQTPIRLKGIVIPAAWDNKGDISALEIAGYDEKKYRVADDLIGRRLRQCIHERIVVEGVIEKTADRATIYVKGFHFDTSLPIWNPDQEEP